MARAPVTSERSARRSRAASGRSGRRRWATPVLVVVLAVIMIGAVAGFVLVSGDSDVVPEATFADACSVVDSAAIAKAVRYDVSTGVAVAIAPPLSGCTFAPTDPAKPPIGVIITDDVRNADSFDTVVLAESYPLIESVRDIGAEALFLSRESGGGPESTDALLVVTEANKGVEISINGMVSPDEAFELARLVAELYVSQLGLG